jgi:hypothetical protein
LVLSKCSFALLCFCFALLCFVWYIDEDYPWYRCVYIYMYIYIYIYIYINKHTKNTRNT